ncbi:PREDICTED: uncharacterized protein LOC108609585 [Drosophila arizonae]|uniref:Uncharacterized protein LOC108609585 n=1 Tax=Drosophila arizonae TaxID=7263 RepID=A0ABM1NPA7_DROAR|nr:PREDICTED: uncharacterized protein LOC108609585 [Drosophila arizonae]
MQHYDIWSDDLQAQTADQQLQMELELIDDQDVAERAEHEQLLLQQSYTLASNLSSTVNWSDSGTYPELNGNGNRNPKVIHLFAVPVDGECLSSDGRRLGNCLNAYECRQKGGQAKGECAMSFGVCCVFVASCNGTINNNLTYIVSPEFPSFMPSNFTGCQLKVKIMSPEISQLRLDLNHFSLGQPNRRTGVCDGDVFNISGGPSGPLTLCGQNNGQHLYYDVGARSLPRQSTLYGTLRQPANVNISEVNASDIEQLIEININVSSRFLPIRLWEIRVTQIPFSQRAPAGCLQYHTGAEGIMQTFNFADNGRHLANQHYRICVRQESDMCSIIYQPCDEQSFRIGGGGSGGSFMSIMNMAASMTSTPSASAQTETASMTTTTATTATSATTPSSAATTTMKPNVAQVLSNLVNCSTTAAPMSSNGSSTTAATGAAAGGNSSTAAMTTSMPLRSSIMPAMDESTAASETTSSSASPSPSPANDDAEGSGDDDNFFFFSKGDDGNNVGTTSQPGVSRRPRPVGGASPSGGFDLLGFLRSALDLRLRHLQQRRHRQSRQFFSTCTDRITMPCIIEDFIGTGFGPLPGCEPVHCGAQFCSSGIWPCRIESTVTPFYIGVHFGDGGAAGKGSAEDNIGACLRYNQVQCI